MRWGLWEWEGFGLEGLGFYGIEHLGCRDWAFLEIDQQSKDICGIREQRGEIQGLGIGNKQHNFALFLTFS